MALRLLRWVACQDGGSAGTGMRTLMMWNRFRTRVRYTVFNRVRTQAAYERFLQSEVWQKLRRLKLKEAGYCCQSQGCARRWGLECHHLIYPARWEQTQLHHLLVLCGPCHRKRHPGAQK
jgi:5-methylcytosine-specific restriction endonuclease McrA